MLFTILLASVYQNHLTIQQYIKLDQFMCANGIFLEVVFRAQVHSQLNGKCI